jgi:hypothetical protein
MLLIKFREFDSEGVGTCVVCYSPRRKPANGKQMRRKRRPADAWQKRRKRRILDADLLQTTKTEDHLSTKTIGGWQKKGRMQELETPRRFMSCGDNH